MDAVAEEDARTNKKAIFGRNITKCKTTLEIKELIDQNPERIIGLHNVMKDYREYQNLSVVQKTHDTCRGIWIQGPPGIGKTWLAREHLATERLYVKS